MTQIAETKKGWKVAEIMTPEVVTIEKGTNIMDAVRKLVEYNFTGLPVVDDKGRLIGIISEKDMLTLAIRINEKEYVSNTMHSHVEDFMTKEVVTIEDTESFTAICNCLIKNQFRRVPVVSNGKLVGIISRKDIISHIMNIHH